MQKPIEIALRFRDIQKELKERASLLEKNYYQIILLLSGELHKVWLETREWPPVLFHATQPAYMKLAKAVQDFKNPPKNPETKKIEVSKEELFQKIMRALEIFVEHFENPPENEAQARWRIKEKEESGSSIASIRDQENSNTPTTTTEVLPEAKREEVEYTPEVQDFVLKGCSSCNGPWHPSTGTIVGSPQRFPFCFRCAQEAEKCLRHYLSTDDNPKNPHRFYAPVPLIK